jgi:hypothetical protein
MRPSPGGNTGATLTDTFPEREQMNQIIPATARGLIAGALIVTGLGVGPALADDVEVVPAPGDGFVVTDSTGSVARFRVLESGEIYVAGALVSIEEEDLPLCYDTVTGKIGGCPPGILGSDDQLLSLAGDTLSIEDGNSVDLSGYLDNTDDQLLSLAANTLSIEDGNSVDLSGYLDNTDVLGGLSCIGGQVAEFDGASWVCTTPSGGADNLGNHIATQNIQLGDFFLSRDGGNEGMRLRVGSTSPHLSTLTVTSTLPSLSIGPSGGFNHVESGRLRFDEDVNYTQHLCGFEFRHDGVLNQLHLEGGCVTPDTVMTARRTGEVAFPTRVLVGGGVPALAPVADLHVKQSSDPSPNPSAGGLLLEQSDTLDRWQIWNSNPNLSFARNGAGVAYINTAGVFNTISDGRLKDDVQDLPSGSLEGVLQLRPVTYRYTHQEPTAPRSTGLIAQEVQAVFPELVHSQDGKQLALAYSELAVVAVQALQELKAEKDAEIAALMARIKALEVRQGGE